MKITTRKREVYGLVLVAALLMRWALIGAAEISPPLYEVTHGGDAIDYLMLRDSLSQHGYYASEGGDPTAFRMPGYPIFLVGVQLIFGKSTLPVLVLQSLLEAVTGLLIMASAGLVMQRLRGDPADRERRLFWVPLLSAGFYLFNPIVAINSISIYPEALATLLVVLGVWALLKAPTSTRYRLLAAAALASSVYFKTTFAAVAALVLLANLVFYLHAYGRRRIALALLPIILLALAPFPWTVRNYTIWGEFVPLATSNGMNLYCGNNDNAVGQNSCGMRWVRAYMTEPESDRYYYQQGLLWIKEHPERFLGLVPQKLFRLLYPLSRAMSGLYPVPPLIFWALNGYVVAGLALFVYGIVVFIQRRWFYPLLLLNSVPAALVFTSIMSYGAYRFLVPAIPHLAITTAIAAGELAHVLSTRQRHHTVASPKRLAHH